MSPSPDPGSGQPADPKQDLLDLPTLQNLVDLDDGAFSLVAEMAAIFRDDTPRRLSDITAALESGQAEDLSRAAHALKGGAGAMGVKALRTLAADLEALGRSGSAEAPPHTVETLAKTFHEALDALDAYVRQGQQAK
jgi:HPt (histidine-containing phosphotransfer) domain-containing protein